MNILFQLEATPPLGEIVCDLNETLSLWKKASSGRGGNMVMNSLQVSYKSEKDTGIKAASFLDSWCKGHGANVFSGRTRTRLYSPKSAEKVQNFKLHIYQLQHVTYC